jgi:hypothetical protein
VGQAGFKTGALMDRGELEVRYRSETERIAQALFLAIHERKFANPSFLSLMTFKIQQLYWQQNPGGSIDYVYWRNQGWIDPQQEFYIRHEANRVKVLSARFTGTVLARFVT